MSGGCVFMKKGAPSSLLRGFLRILLFQSALDLAPILGGHGGLGVVFRAAEAPVQGRGDQGSLFVIFAVRVRAELAKRSRRVAADGTLVPRALPLPWEEKRER